MGVLKSTTGQGSWQETARGKLRALLQTGSALAVVLTLGACSSVPDAINPVEWGKSVGDMFDGEDEEAAVKSDEAIPGEDGEYPSLSDTPAKPVVTGDAERDALVAGLAADRQNAQYEQGGRRQSSPPVNALQTAPAAPASQPVINPAPTTPVTSSAMADAGTAAAATATTSAVTSAPSGSSIADEWNAKSAASGPVPTPEAPPAAPSAAQGDARAQQLAAYEAAQGSNVTSSGDPVMDQYQRRLAEGQGVFANEPAAPSAQEFDYSMYSDNGAVIVDESQFGGAEPMYGDSASYDMTVTNDALASRLGVRSIDQAGPAVSEVQIAQIQFGHGSTNLGGADYSVLEQVAATWQQTSGFIRVIGHASMRTGNMSLEQHLAVNRRVSEGRAAAVVSRLLSLGVSPDAIFVGADGSADPRYYEGVPAGEAGNRRVEIYLDY
ncbi:flagellar motor protein MotB [Thalassospira sp. HJ]|uniref:OmpA family protein n=1 Tax=Thalassospira sp. HJ TaxID=1616823 RepID=UPI0005CE4562|nr:OmpA family protein [Thalassospira sp. HJ]KJE35277.1 flagellar motor protein MotB [Thalassospira sp. HJ]